jgi:hypothetical protein
MKTLFKKFLPKKIRNIRHLFYAWYGAVKYDNPSEEIFVIGITGTSGKSSTTYFLRQILEAAGFKVGSLSTIDFYVGGEHKLNDQMAMLGKMQIQNICGGKKKMMWPLWKQLPKVWCGNIVIVLSIMTDCAYEPVSSILIHTAVLKNTKVPN